MDRKNRATVSLSVVVFRDFASPLQMIGSLDRVRDRALPIKLYVVDNSALSSGDPLERERESFVTEVSCYDFVEYIDAGVNLGFGRANNLALEHADSEFHIFVNPDVTFVEDAISELVEFMRTHPEVGMCIPRILDERMNLQYACRRDITVLDALNRTFFQNALSARDRFHSMKDMDYGAEFQVPFGQGSFLMARTSQLKSLGGFDESFFLYLEDADLCKRMNMISKVVYCPNATIVHKWERASHKSLNLLIAHCKSYRQYFQKWGVKLA